MRTRAAVITPPRARDNLNAGAIRTVEGMCMATQISAEYRPSESEPFMNEKQREYFRRKLNAMKEEILKESRETIQNLQAETVPHADLADRASTEAERQLELRTHLLDAIETQGRRVEHAAHQRRSLLARGLDWLAYALMRIAVVATGKRY